ncbi:MAG: sigma 54-interacting transcriptional regulator [Firmicutes bacterium]|nr:sigma 54-interacting transcriptional regulator [Bacillota bacterium]
MDKTFKDVNTIAKMIFDFLVREKDLQNENLALCTGDGSVLTSFPAQGEGDKTFTSSASDSEFTIIADSACTRTEEIEDLQNSFSKFFSIFYSNERLRNFIFDGLDALPNSICIYDENLRLLYANSDFCSYLHIKDRDVDLGRPINDILKDRGVQFTSVKKPHDYLKVNDVIRYGKPVIDWEVEVTSLDDPSGYMIASNDMYPMLDSKGAVSGVAEISRSRNTKIKQARDTLGLTADYTFEDIIGNSKPMTDVKKLAMSFAVSPYNVLIYGESGVGKELFAQSIHNYSIRRNKPFVAINCASISPELIDSELFGYESGAFTGAAKNGHVGKFELSNGGTLFLDEVAELPLHAQTKLLRTLETHQITKVGGTKNISVDVRVIAATNRSLEKMIEEGLFREDLYYRLMVLNITIPPLRERPEDIIPCCEFFMKQAMRINNSEMKTIDDSAKKLLIEYDWPGNGRELRNVINRVYVMSNSSVITREDLIGAFLSSKVNLSSLSKSKTPEEMLREKRMEINRSYVALLKEALLLANGNKTEAAKLIGVSRKTVYNMLEKYKDYFE